jgi:hypothetical protein
MQELQETQLQYVSPSTFISDQLFLFFSCVFIWLAGLWFAGFSRAGRQFRFMAWAYLIVIGLLLYLHGKGYYAAGVYPPLIAFGAYHLEKVTATRLKWLRYVFMLIPLSLIRFVAVLLPVLPPAQLAALYETMPVKKLGALRWEDLKDHPLPQDFADMLGWKEMAAKAGDAWQLLDSNEKKHAIIFCDNYGQAGAVTFYAKQFNIPEAYSDNASFLYWMPDSMHIDNLVLLTGDKEEMQHSFIKDFKSAQVIDSVTNQYARERGSLIILLKGANDSFNQMFKEKIAKDRAVFVHKQ